MSEPSVSVARLEQFLAAFNAHDLNAIMQFFADDCELLMPRGKEPGVHAMSARQLCARGWQLALPDFPTFTMARTAIG